MAGVPRTSDGSIDGVRTIGLQMNPLIYACFGLLFLAFLAVAFLSLPYLWDFKVTEQGVEEYVLHAFRIRTIRFDQISDVRLMKREDWFSVRPRQYAGNRIRSKSVLLTKKTGILKSIALTPADPEGFVTMVGRGIERAREARAGP